jgi:hypothetical protein
MCGCWRRPTIDAMDKPASAFCCLSPIAEFAVFLPDFPIRSGKTHGRRSAQDITVFKQNSDQGLASWRSPNSRTTRRHSAKTRSMRVTRREVGAIAPHNSQPDANGYGLPSHCEQFGSSF